MEKLTYRFTLDTHKNGIQRTLQGFQIGDNMSRQFEITLKENGESYDIPLDGVIAVMYSKRPSQTNPSVNSCTIDNNVIRYEVPSTDLTEEGMVQYQLKLISGTIEQVESVLVSPKFEAEVWESEAQDSSAEDTPTYTALEEALIKAQAVYNSRITSFLFNYDIPDYSGDHPLELTVVYGYDDEEEVQITYVTDVFEAATDEMVQRIIEDLPELINKMDKLNPVGSGSFSMNRKSNTTVGSYSSTLGYNGTASGSYSHTDGVNTIASGYATHAEGEGTQATYEKAHAEGSNTLATNTASHAEGGNSSASGEYSHAEGLRTFAKNRASHAEGDYTVAFERDSHAEGIETIAMNNYSHAEGYKSYAGGDEAHAEGYQTYAMDNYAHTEGYMTVASGDGAHAEGYQTFAKGNYSHAEGRSAESKTHLGFDSFSVTGTITAINDRTQSEYNPGIDISISVSNITNFSANDYVMLNGNYDRYRGNIVKIVSVDSSNSSFSVTFDKFDYKTVSLGTLTVGGTIDVYRQNKNVSDYRQGALGDYSHSEGMDTQANGDASHAEGRGTIANTYAHAEGYNTRANGSVSHAEGFQTTAGASGAHAEGENTTATAFGTHAEGGDSTASGLYSHAEGRHTIASGDNQHVAGAYNIEDTDSIYARITGNGTYSNRSNAETLDWNGNLWVAGNVTDGNGNVLSGKQDLLVSGTNIKTINNESILGSGNINIQGGGGTDKMDKNNPVGTGSLSMNRYEGSTVGTDSVTLNGGEEIITNLDPSEPQSQPHFVSESGTQATFNCVTTWADSNANDNVLYFHDASDDFVMSIISETWDSTNMYNVLVLDNTDDHYFSSSLTYTVDKVIHYYDNTASGNGSLAEGWGNTASGKTSHTEGKGNTASGNCSHAEGIANSTAGNYSHVEGCLNEITLNGSYGHAEGSQNTVSNSMAHAEGHHNTVSGIYAHVEGYFSTASGQQSHAEGQGTKAQGADSHAEGNNTTASGNRSHAEGQNTKATQNNAHAEGMSTTASGYHSHAEGEGGTASGGSSHKEGYYSSASGNYSHAEGMSTQATRDASHAEGNACQAKAKCAHAEGSYCLASSDNQHVSGTYNVEDSQGVYAVIVGNGTANNARSNAGTLDWSGNLTVAGDITDGYGNVLSQAGQGGLNKMDKADPVGTGSFSMNRKENTTIGNYSATLGNSCTASATSDFANGSYTTASGGACHAEGSRTTAQGNHTHAEGEYATSSGSATHAEGYNTTAQGNYTHAEGYETTTSGTGSHAEGYKTTASGNYSHAEGNSTKASSANQHVSGKYNVEDANNTYAAIVGNGTANDARSNAYTLDWSGNVVVAGNVTDGSGNVLSNKMDLPTLPSTDGTYTLQVTISNGTPTFSWV